MLFRSDLVIAKGQGNYETLSDAAGDIFFLLKVKCPIVARQTGLAEGSIVLYHQDRAPSLRRPNEAAST